MPLTSSSRGGDRKYNAIIYMDITLDGHLIGRMTIEVVLPSSVLPHLIGSFLSLSYVMMSHHWLARTFACCVQGKGERTEMASGCIIKAAFSIAW
jgi:hypothetical protein